MILNANCSVYRLGVFNPTETSKTAYQNSICITEPLVDLILQQARDFEPTEVQTTVSELRKQIDLEAEEVYKRRLECLEKDAPAELKSSIKIANEKGASSWVQRFLLMIMERFCTRANSRMHFTFATAGNRPIFPTLARAVWRSM